MGSSGERATGASTSFSLRNDPSDSFVAGRRKLVAASPHFAETTTVIGHAGGGELFHTAASVDCPQWITSCVNTIFAFPRAGTASRFHRAAAKLSAIDTARGPRGNDDSQVDGDRLQTTSA